MTHTVGMIGTYRRFGEDAPDEVTETGAELFYHRTQTMVCCYLRGPAGASYTRRANPDESFIWALFQPVVVTAGAARVEVPAGSVVIVPPGDSEVALGEAGEAWVGFTALATDLLGRCPNNAEYAEPLANVAPIVLWPEPVGGYRLRVYALDDGPAGKPHCYRHRSAMTSLSWPVRTEPRDPATLSPHTHDDFEQASLLHSGTQVHHLRRAWSRDLREWMPDEHVELVAPAIAISKPPDLHTTQAVSAGTRVGLIDYFAPPRWDFSNVDGMVLNAAEYPMPAEAPVSYANATRVYAADDPRAAIEQRR